MRRGFQTRFTHIFVDEFQDTDPLQAEILLLLASEDPARDRLAPGHARPRPPLHRRRSQAVDLSLPARGRRHLSRRRASGSRARRAAGRTLTTSFRSVPADPGVRQRRVRAGDDRRCRSRSRPTTCRCRRFAPTCKRQPAVVALPVPEAVRQRATSRRWRSKQSLPDAVGAFVDWLVNESGWKVTERDRREAGPGGGAAHLHPVPPVPQLRRGHDAAVRAGARGARRASRARRRQDVSRPRGGRNAPRRAGGDRVAGRRAVGVRDAARRAVRDRGRGAARVEAAVRQRSTRSGFHTRC